MLGAEQYEESWQTTPVHDAPYIWLLLLCATLLLYGGHGCHPVRHVFSPAPLGSSAAATDCRMVYMGALIPRLVPKLHPLP